MLSSELLFGPKQVEQNLTSFGWVPVSDTSTFRDERTLFAVGMVKEGGVCENKRCGSIVSDGEGQNDDTHQVGKRGIPSGTLT